VGGGGGGGGEGGGTPACVRQCGGDAVVRWRPAKSY
jgi:hypothetical protein